MTASKLFLSLAVLSAAVTAAEAADRPVDRDASVLVARADTTARAVKPQPAAQSMDPGVRGAQAAAAKGPTALRLYIQRTRMIYALRYEDFLQP